MKRILFVYKDYSQFVRKDFEMFSKQFRVIKLKSTFDKSPISFLMAGLRQFFSLIRFIGSCDAVYCWFADYHALLPALFSKIFRKPFYLVLGGYDVAYLEELNYGSFNRKFRGFCARYAMRTATLNLPVAKVLGEMAEQRAGNIRIKVLPTGFDPELYPPSEEKEEMILTVAITSSRQRFLIKGLDRFVDLAREMQDHQFVLIGIGPQWEHLLENRPPNLELLPPLKHEELINYYGRAKYYAQFSRSEGLPNAICEAMLRNCIPLGINIGGIPEAIGDAGILLEDWDVKVMSEQISGNSKSDLLSQRARERIIRLFQNDRREKELNAILAQSEI